MLERAICIGQLQEVMTRTRFIDVTLSTVLKWLDSQSLFESEPITRFSSKISNLVAQSVCPDHGAELIVGLSLSNLMPLTRLSPNHHTMQPVLLCRYHYSNENAICLKQQTKSNTIVHK